MLFKSRGQNFTHKRLSFCGIKFLLITPEYKRLKALFKNIRIKDYGNNNRVIILDNPCVKGLSGGGATLSL